MADDVEEKDEEDWSEALAENLKNLETPKNTSKVEVSPSKNSELPVESTPEILQSPSKVVVTNQDKLSLQHNPAGERAENRPKNAGAPNPQKPFKSDCHPRSRDVRKCQKHFQDVIGKHEIRNEELEQLEGDLRQRLQALESSMPAVMVWNIWRTIQGKPTSAVRRVMEKQFQGFGAGNVPIPTTSSQHWDERVRKVEAERKEALRRAEEARALLAEKEAAVLERRKRLEEAKKCYQERKEMMEKLARDAAEQREALKNARGDDNSDKSGECGEIRKEKWLDAVGSVSSIGSTDLESFAKLQELAEAEICMKRQISELERREEAYMRTLQQADEMWSKMEGDTTDTVSLLQDQLDLKTTANQQLAERICQLEDELENLKKKLISSKEALSNYTSKVFTAAKSGHDDSEANVKDRGILAAVKTAPASATAVPDTFDQESSAYPEKKDKESLVVSPEKSHVGIIAVPKTSSKISEARPVPVDQTHRGVDPVSELKTYATDRGVGPASELRTDTTHGGIDPVSQVRIETPVGDEENIPEHWKNWNWEEGCPPDILCDDMIESATGTDECRIDAGPTASKVQASSAMVDHPISGLKNDQVAISPEELRNWYNIVDSLHHMIAIGDDCSSKTDDVAQLAAKMKSHLRIKGVAGVKGPVITPERVLQAEPIQSGKHTSEVITPSVKEMPPEMKSAVVKGDVDHRDETDRHIPEIDAKISGKISSPTQSTEEVPEETIPGDSTEHIEESEHQVPEDLIDHDDDLVDETMSIISEDVVKTDKDISPLFGGREETLTVTVKESELDFPDSEKDGVESRVIPDSKRVEVESKEIPGSEKVDIESRETPDLKKVESESKKIPDSEKVEVESKEVPDSEKVEVESKEVPELEKVEVKSKEVSDSEKVEVKSKEVPDSEKVEVESKEVPGSEKGGVKSKEVPDSEKVEVESKEVPDSEKDGVKSKEVPDSERVDVESEEVPDSERVDVESEEVPDSEKVDVESEEVPDSEKLEVEISEKVKIKSKDILDSEKVEFESEKTLDVEKAEDESKDTQDSEKAEIESEEIPEPSEMISPTESVYTSAEDFSEPEFDATIVTDKSIHERDPQREPTDLTTIDLKEEPNLPEGESLLEGLAEKAVEPTPVPKDDELELEGPIESSEQPGELLIEEGKVELTLQLEMPAEEDSKIEEAPLSFVTLRTPPLSKLDVRKESKDQILTISDVEEAQTASDVVHEKRSSEVIVGEELEELLLTIEDVPVEKQETMPQLDIRLPISVEPGEPEKVSITKTIDYEQRPEIIDAEGIPELEAAISKPRVVAKADSEAKPEVPEVISQLNVKETERPKDKLVEDISTKGKITTDRPKAGKPYLAIAKVESWAKLEIPKPVGPCICKPRICPLLSRSAGRQPKLKVVGVVTSGTQTSPSIPKTVFGRMDKQKLPESTRPFPGVPMSRRPTNSPRCLKERRTLRTACVDTQTDSTLVRQRKALQGITQKDDCTCSGACPRKPDHGGCIQRMSNKTTSEKRPAPVSLAAAKLIGSTNFPTSMTSCAEKEICVVRYAGRSFISPGSYLDCIECGRPITPGGTVVLTESTIQTTSTSQKSMINSLMCMASSTSGVTHSKDGLICCDCKTSKKLKTHDGSGSKRQDHKDLDKRRHDQDVCCPCPPKVAKKTSSKSSKKKRKPEMKDQAVMANIPKDSSKTSSKEMKWKSPHGILPKTKPSDTETKTASKIRIPGKESYCSCDESIQELMNSGASSTANHANTLMNDPCNCFLMESMTKGSSCNCFDANV